MESLFYRSLGLELSGPRTQRTTIAVLDHYPQSQRLVLSDLITPESGSDDPDQSLKNHFTDLVAVSHYTGCGVHAPLSLPPVLEYGKKVLSSSQIARLPEVKWMDEMWKKIKDRPPSFVPYLHRPAEVWLRYKSVERFGDVMSFATNGAALAARALYLKHQLAADPLHEMFPRAIVKRLTESLEMRPFVYKRYSDLEHGLSAREDFLMQLSIKLPQIFLYDKDVEKMILNLSHFHAFLCALMQHMVHKGEYEHRPKGYPTKATWIHIPRLHINWDKVF